MKLDFLHKKDSNRRLLLIFNGWSVPAEALTGVIAPAGYDLAVVTEYDDFCLPAPGDYNEVVVLAWSLGVHAAEVALKKSSLPLTLTIAVNGTPSPISDSEGIPTEVFRLTAERLTEQSLVKFRRRMGGGALPRGNREIEALRQELLRFPDEPVDFRWDYALISSDDSIFPPENQRQAWRGRSEIIELEGGHTPGFNDIIRRLIISKVQVGTRFARGMKTYPAEATVQNRIAGHLLELWLKHRDKRPGGTILEIGVGSGGFTSLYSDKIRPEELILWDLAPVDESVERADGETAIRQLSSSSLRAVVSASTMQWFNSPAAFLEEVGRVLEPGGLAVISTFGPDTFTELTACGVTPLPYLSEDSLRRIIPDSLEVLELHDGKIVKVFNSPMEALRHCRATGVNARPTAVSVREIERRWERLPDGRISLTFQPIYLILRKLW